MPHDLDKLSDEQALALLRKERKKQRDRQYWRRNAGRLNRRRREKYAQEQAILEQLKQQEDGDDGDVSG